MGTYAVDETLKPWYPIPGTDEELFLETVVKGLEGLEVTLSTGEGATRSLILDFGKPIAYRVNPDYVYMKRPWWGTLSGGPLYIVENSTFRQWLETETLGVYDQQYSHFFIISVDGCLDVLTLSEPKAQWRYA